MLVEEKIVVVCKNKTRGFNSGFFAFIIFGKHRFIPRDSAVNGSSLHPLRMEAAWLVHTLIGMGAEVIPLGLQYVGVAAGGAVGIKVGQGTA